MGFVYKTKITGGTGVCWTEQLNWPVSISLRKKSTLWRSLGMMKMFSWLVNPSLSSITTLRKCCQGLNKSTIESNLVSFQLKLMTSLVCRFWFENDRLKYSDNNQDRPRSFSGLEQDEACKSKLLGRFTNVLKGLGCLGHCYSKKEK